MKITTICQRCGKSIKVFPCFKNTKYCSKKCYFGEQIKIKCQICNKVFKVSKHREKTAKYCSHKCFDKSKIGKPSWNKGLKGVMPTPWNKGKTGCMPPAWNKGKKLSRNMKIKLALSHLGKFKEKASNWKGGERIDFFGQPQIYMPEHPSVKNRKYPYVRKSRLVVENIIGRYLKSKEIVHHIDKNPSNFSPDNLYVFTSQGYHSHFHTKVNKGLLKLNSLQSNLSTYK